MKKKVLSICLIAMLIVLVGCGQNSDESSSAGKAAQGENGENTGNEVATSGFKIGYPDMAALNSTMEAMFNNAAAVVEAAGGELVLEACDPSPDATISAIEKLISAGVKGIMLTPASDAMLPSVIKMCEDAQVYLALTFRSINDPEVKELVEASPYYVGNCFGNEEESGYNAAKLLGEEGVKQLAIVSLAKGDTTADMRELGVRNACEEEGIEIVAEARALSQASDGTKAAESFMSSYPDLDGILVVSTQTAGIPEAIVSAVESAGKIGQLHVGVCDFTDNIAEAMEAGVISAMCGGHVVADRTLTAAMVTNAVLGTPLSDKPYSIRIPFMYLRNVEDAKTYVDLVISGEPAYSQDEIKQNMLKTDNPEVTADSLQALADQWSIEYLSSRHGTNES
jgi:ABC-type sugar transport system substrate-binding protein